MYFLIWYRLLNKIGLLKHLINLTSSKCPTFDYEKFSGEMDRDKLW
jgi:hypothetical protein